MTRLSAVTLTGLMTLSALALGGNAASDAASITHTAGSTSKTQQGLFPRFNPTLGTLTHVDIAATGTSNGQFLVVQPAPPSFSYTARLSLLGGFGFPGFFDIVDTFTATGITPFTLAVNTVDSFSGSTSITQPSLLAAYLGTAPINLQVWSTYTSHDPTHFRVDPTRFNFATTSVAVTYNYLPPGAAVAEPSSALMGVIALAILVAVRRRFACN